MEEKRFNSALSCLRLGLVRLDEDFYIIDKNDSADAVIQFPKRGASVIPLFGIGITKLQNLPSAAISSCGVVLNNGSARKNAVAIRERSGDILLMLHPLFSTLHVSNISGRYSKMLSVYAESVYGIIEEMENEAVLSSHQTSPAFSDFFFTGIMSGGYSDVKLAVRRLTNKLENIVTKKNINIRLNGFFTAKPVGVIYSTLEYAAGEMIVLREMYGTEETTELKIAFDDKWLTFTLNDKITDGKTARYYVRIISEILKAMGLGSFARIFPDGRLIFNTYIPYEKSDGRLHDSANYEAPFDYINYCINYLNIKNDSTV